MSNPPAADSITEGSEPVSRDERFNTADAEKTLFEQPLKWRIDEDSKLLAAVEKQVDEVSWPKVAKLLPGKTAVQCQARWEILIKRDGKKGNWSVEEDELLRKWVVKHGPTEWTSCALIIKGRNGKQCRERWVNILDPSVKIGGWSDIEQMGILNAMKEHMTSWSTISRFLPGRTENSIKNYFYSTVRRAQASNVFEYFLKVKNNRPVPKFESSEKFIEHYNIGHLNALGLHICAWLWDMEVAKSQNLELYNYLLNTMTDEKKKPKTSKDLNKMVEQEHLKSLQPPDQKNQEAGEEGTEGYNSFGQQFLDPRLFNGVHPLLPIALYGGLSNMSVKNFLQVMSPLVPYAANPMRQDASRPAQTPQFKLKDDDDFSDISVPIPSSNNGSKFKPPIGSNNPVNLGAGGNPGTNPLQQKLLSMLVQNLSLVQNKQGVFNAPKLPSQPGPSGR
jgi:Myb-like DNA-binding domain